MKKKTKRKRNNLVKIKISTKKNVRMADIAKQVGVAISTVSRVLSGSPNSVKIADKTKKKILKIATELGYASHHIPVKYHKGVRSVMVVSYDPGEIFYQKIISAIERTMRKKNYACYFSYTEANPKQAGEIIEAMGERFTSGCVIFQNDIEMFTPVNKVKLESLGIPCVLIDHHPLPLPPFVSTVELDNEKAGYDVAAYLLRLGHKHFAFLRDSEISSCPERQAGVEKKLNESGLKLEKNYIGNVASDSRFQLIDTFKKWMKNKSGFPTAIITTHDILGYAVLNVLESLNINVPTDVSLISFDDRIELVPWGLDNIRLPLTSIRQPIESIGIVAANELISRINNPNRQPEHIKLKGELIIRESTTKPRVNKLKVKI